MGIPNNKKYTYEVIKQLVEDKGYELEGFQEPSIENKYKPKIIISNKYESKLMYFDNFMRGKFKFKPNTAESIKSKIEDYYSIELDYVKSIEQSKQNMSDILEIKFGDKIITRSIGSLLNSLQQGNNIFADTRKDVYTYEEVYSLLSNTFNKLDSFDIVYDGEFQKNRARYVVTIKGVKYNYTWTSLINRLELVTEHVPFTPRKSKGELKVMGELCKHNIDYIDEKTFQDCKYNGKHALRFDFYLTDYNICIEYDGKHHFKDVNLYNMKTSLREVKNRDLFKNNYCKEKGIKLIRIPFTKFNDIPNIIQDIVSSN